MRLWTRIFLLAAVLASVIWETGPGVDVGRPGSGADGERGRVVLRFWNGFTGPDGRTMLRMVQRFNAENPDVYVVMQRMEWGTYYNKLFVANLGGRGPEVFVVQDDVLARFQRAGMLRSVDDMVGSGKIQVLDMDPAVWGIVQYGGHAVGLPLDLHLLGMYYNVEMLKGAGVVDEKGEARPPRDRAEFMEMLKRVKGAGGIGFVYAYMRSNATTVMKQFGGSAFSEDGSRCTLDDPGNVAGLAFCRSLVAEGLVPSPEGTDGWIGFRQGKVGCAWEGVYKLADLERVPGLRYAGATVPVLGEHAATLAGSHVLCLRPDLKGREVEGAERFLGYLSDHSLEWAAGGQIPVRKSLRETEAFRRMGVQAAFAKGIPDLFYGPRVAFVLEYQAELDLAIEEALRGTESPAEALKAATVRVNAVMARDREMYASEEKRGPR